MSAAVKWRPSSRGHSRFPPHRATASQTTKLPPFEDFINRLAATGITTGCSTNTFCPNDPVTREQMAAFLVRAYVYGDATVDRFVDDESSALENEINRLAAAGITTGCTTDRFCPRDPVLRDQMATFLVRAENLTSISVPPPNDCSILPANNIWNTRV
ncbi:MAG: S-layer homology domain-containing protein, partial [bacterium]